MQSTLKILFIIALLLPRLAFAGAYSVTFTSSTAATNEAGGGVAWTSVGSVTVNDSTPGSVNLKPFEISDYANATKFSTASPGLYLHPRSVITGVALTVICQCDTADSCQMTEAQLVDGLTPQGTADASVKPLETTYKDTVAGGDGSMFGLTSAQLKTLAQQKNFGFRFWIAEIAGNAVVADCNGMTITFYYDVLPKLHALTGANL